MGDAKMTVRPERNYKRDLTYSLWHRTLGPEYPMIDLDGLWIEIRNGRIIAFIETKQESESHTDFQRGALLELSTLRPTYTVRHNHSLTWFQVYRWADNMVLLEGNQEEYKAWLTKL